MYLNRIVVHATCIIEIDKVRIGTIIHIVDGERPTTLKPFHDLDLFAGFGVYGSLEFVLFIYCGNIDAMVIGHSISVALSIFTY